MAFLADEVIAIVESTLSNIALKGKPCYYFYVIGKIKGEVVHIGYSHLIVMASGVGYRVFVTGETISGTGLGKIIELWTHLSVKENALDLFGFPDEAALNIFRRLISVSGIGPKTALTILNLVSPKALRVAITSGDAARLTKVSGIGLKRAEKIIIELRDKLSITAEERAEGFVDDGDAIEALKALGYGEREARDALKKIPKEVSGAGNRVKSALKILGK